tara:strand:+ start:2201 stop:3745 length:1545 start_codon:yes stop_codon:yes gene_type:complete
MENITTNLSTETKGGVDILMKSPTEKFQLSKFSVDAFNSASLMVKYSKNFQRYYLFYNKIGDPGHEWQRNLFLSIINYEPIGQIEWVKTVHENGKVTTTSESLDGQQRTKTFLAIMGSLVKLPGDKSNPKSFIQINGRDVDVSGYTLSDIQKYHEGYFNEWKSTYSFIVLESELEKKDKHLRFQKVNDHNTLSSQDILSSLDNPLSNYINDLTLPEIPFHKFARVKDGALEFEYLNCSPKGKLLQEIIAKYIVCVHKDGFTNIGGSQVKKLYNEYEKEVNTESTLKSFKKRIEKVLKTADYVITKTSNKFWKKRDVLMLFITIDLLYKKNVKFDAKKLAGKYQRIIGDLKGTQLKLNSWAVDKGYLTDVDKCEDYDVLQKSVWERDNTFSSCYQQGDSKHPLEFVIETILKQLEKEEIAKNVSKKRAFTKEEKRHLLLSQDCKCASCRVELEVDLMGTYEADHIIPFKDGGDTELSNGEALCLDCHQDKTLYPERYEKMRKRFDMAYSQQPKVA